MKVKQKKLKEAILLLILIFNDHAYHILGDSRVWNLLSLILVVLLFFLYFDIKKDKNMLYVTIFFISINVFSAIVTYLCGYQSYYEAFLAYLPILFSLISLVFFGEKDNDIIQSSIEKLSVIISSLYILQKIFFPKIIFISEFSFRNNQIRFYVGILPLVIGTLFLIGKLIEKRNFWILLPVILNIYCIVYIIQARSVTIALFLAILSTSMKFFIDKLKNKKIFLLAIMLLPLIILCIYVFGNYVYSTVDNSISSNESSSVIRFQAYKYYWSLFTQHPILGTGIIYNKGLDGLSTLGYNSGLYIDDIGIVGYISQLGLFAIIFTFIWFKLMIKYTVKIANFDFFSITLYFILILPFNCIFNINSYILYAFLILNLTYFTYRKSKWDDNT